MACGHDCFEARHAAQGGTATTAKTGSSAAPRRQDNQNQQPRQEGITGWPTARWGRLRKRITEYVSDMARIDVYRKRRFLSSFCEKAGLYSAKYLPNLLEKHSWNRDSKNMTFEKAERL